MTYRYVEGIPQYCTHKYIGDLKISRVVHQSNIMSAEDDPTSLDWELHFSSPDAVTEPVAVAGGGCFAGKVIVITGAGGQLGREGCLYFAQRGAKIAALDLSADGLKGTLECLSEQQQQQSHTFFHFKPYVCDVTNAESVDLVMSHICQSRFGRIDLLWNNAGYQGQITPILSMSPVDFATVMNINVTGMFIVLQAVAKRMVEQQKQASTSDSTTFAIVNTASVAGLRGTPAMAAYASSKAAVLALTVTAAKELAVHNIRVNAISPALIGPGTLWERQNDLHAAVGSPHYAESSPAVAQAKIQQVPMKRLGSPREVVKSVAFLFSDEASYTTGINLTIDGGLSAGLKA